MMMSFTLDVKVDVNSVMESQEPEDFENKWGPMCCHEDNEAMQSSTALAYRAGSSVHWQPTGNPDYAESFSLGAAVGGVFAVGACVGGVIVYVVLGIVRKPRRGNGATYPTDPLMGIVA